MAILLPNYLQTGSYSAKKDRRVNSAEILQEGIVRKGHYKVAQRAAGANMSVDVAAGEAWVKGDSAVDQGYYHVVNDATVNATVSAANATNPRIDAVVLAVNDSTEVGGSDSYLLEVIAGTPTAGATLANLKGAPSGVAGPTIGATKLLLAYVLVPAAASSVLTTNIGGLRDPRNYNGELGMTKAEAYAVAEAPPQYAHGRPLDWVPAAQALRTTEYSSASPIIVPFVSGENFDTEEIHDLVTNPSRFIAKTPGVYLMQAHATYVTTFSTLIGLIRVNGAGTQFGRTYIPTSSGIGVSAYVRLGYGDYAEFVMEVGEVKNVTNSAATLVWQGP